MDDGATYNFESRFEAGANSVSYDGQTARHVLLVDLKSYVGGLGDSIDRGDFMPADGDVVAALDFYFRFDSDAYGEEAHLVSTEPGALQETYNDVSTGKDLVGKLAGNDTSTDHVDWSTEFSGWSDESIAAYGGSIDSPEGLALAFFETLEENAIGRSDGVVRSGPDGEQLPVYVTDAGQDLNQLIQKFLTVAIAFHQGTDDYLDDDVDGKGLKADHAAAVEGKPYTALEHAWDEGFGYFGAARDYAAYTDDEIAAAGGRDEYASGYHDTNGDGAIDLLSEYNFGHAVNAAKRDRGSNAATDMTAQAFEAFRAGRALLAATDGPLDAAQVTELEGYRDQAVLAWEEAIAATVVHYINDTLQEMEKFGTDDYSFAEHAKVWSEMKGFALGFQFNPRSPVSDEDFTALHALLRDAPVLSDADSAEIDAYRSDLVAARDILRDAYGFDSSNMGDDKGEGGW
ncbi:MAG: DUF4856 domain-containing protein [Myxococcales bacterium]|nr:DUF4856 domain-containing protein [Myxococcales bacterium]